MGAQGLAGFLKSLGGYTQYVSFQLVPKKGALSRDTRALDMNIFMGNPITNPQSQSVVFKRFKPSASLKSELANK